MDSYVTDLNVLVIEGSRPKGSVIPPVPTGWKKIETDLNEGAGGDYLYFLYRQDTDSAPLTGVTVLRADDSVPPGYIKNPVNLNSGNRGEILYVAIARDPSCGNPIDDLTVVSGPEPDIEPPPGYHKVETDLNEGAKGHFVHLVYRAR